MAQFQIQQRAEHDFRDYDAAGLAVDGSEDWSAVLTAASAGAVSAGAGLSGPPGTLLVSDDVTFAAPVSLKPGSLLKPASGKKITINGAFSAGLVQCFDLSLGGEVEFGEGAVERALPQWFGLTKAGSMTANAAAVQATIDAVASAGLVTVDFGAGSYALNQVNIDGVDGLRVTGSGKLYKTGGSSAACIFRVTDSTDVHIFGFKELDGGYTSPSTGSNPIVQLGVPGEAGVNDGIHVYGTRLKNGNHACITAFGETDTPGEFGNKNLHFHDLELERAGAGIFVYKGCHGLFVTDVHCAGVGANGLVLDTRAATDDDTVNTWPIEHVRIAGLRVTDVEADTGFEPRGVVIKGAVSDVVLDGLEADGITSEDGTARNTYGVLIAASYGPGSGAVATANLTGTAVSSFTVSAGGSGYTTPPKVFISSSSGGGAKGTAVLTDGVVTSITVDEGGEGYTEAPYVQLIAGEVGENIKILNASIENVQDLDGTTGWPIYVQSGWRDVTIKTVRLKNCKRGINVDAADVVHIEDIISRDLPLQASTFPVQIAGASAAAPATNVKIGKVTADRGAGLDTATHAIAANFVDGLVIREDCSQVGFDTGLLSISTSNAKRVSGAIGSGTLNPSSLADGAGETLTVSCPGASVGDFVEAAFSQPLQGVQLTQWVSATNTVSVRFQNETGDVVNLDSGTMKVRTTR